MSDIKPLKCAECDSETFSVFLDPDGTLDHLECAGCYSDIWATKKEANMICNFCNREFDALQIENIINKVVPLIA
jgi:hypothetical protein